MRIPIMKPPSQATGVSMMPEPVQFLLSHEYCGKHMALAPIIRFHMSTQLNPSHLLQKYLTTLAFWCPIWNGWSFPSDHGISSTARLWKDHVAHFYYAAWLVWSGLKKNATFVTKSHRPSKPHYHSFNLNVNPAGKLDILEGIWSQGIELRIPHER